MEKKILLVIGASSDLGMELISRVIDNYDLIIAHYRTMSESFLKLLNFNADRVISIQADFSEQNGVDAFVNKLMELEVVPSHIVFFHSSPLQFSSIERSNWEKYYRAFEISVSPIFNVIKTFVPFMKRNKSGKIIITLTNSVNGIPPKFLSQYLMTKYALLGLVRSLSADYADKNIQINGVSPEMIETKFIKDIPDYVKEQNALDNPMKRNLGVKDVIPTYIWLLSDGADSVTGQNIAVTGGR